MQPNRKNLSLDQLNCSLIKPNRKNPWARRVRNRHRLKQMLRGVGLAHSFFTKQHTRARCTDYREALKAVGKAHGSKAVADIKKIWGEPQPRKRSA